MKKSEIIELYNKLTSIKDLKGAKFNYAIARNIALLEPEIKSIQKVMEPNEDFKTFDQKRIELCEKHAIKEDGKAVMDNNAYKIEDQKAFDKDFDALKEEYKDTIDAREAQIKDFNTLLDTETEITLHKIKEEDIPNEITTEQMNMVISLVE